MDDLIAQETADTWGVSLRWVHKRCENGRIQSTRRFGRDWMIPKDAHKPPDTRTREHRKERLQ